MIFELACRRKFSGEQKRQSLGTISLIVEGSLPRQIFVLRISNFCGAPNTLLFNK